jgi:hypothetical protein
MTIMESIVKGLRELSPRQLVEVAALVHRLNPNAAAEREAILRETYGCLSEEEADAFEAAVAGSRRLEENGQ